MPSRKKARGRQNRAKKEAIRTVVEQRSLWEPMVLRSNHGVVAAVQCEHMMTGPPRIPQEGPAVSFMNHIAGEGYFNKTARFRNAALMDFCSDSLSLCFPGVRKEGSERALAIALLLRFVRNTLVHESVIEGECWFHLYRGNEAAICCMIHLLELLGKYSDMAVVERRAIRMNNRLTDGNRRDVVKFVTKRLPCTCLKKLHSAARKKTGKVGKCKGCREQFPRSQLHVCTGCMVSEYCSKECQRANWSHHKQCCGDPEVMSPDLPAHYVFFKRNL